MSNTTQQSVEEMIEEYQGPLKSFIRKRVSSTEDAEDILQDVFYQLSKVDNLLNPIEQVSSWLYRVTRNAIINKRTKKREQELPIYHIYQGDDEVIRDFSEILFDAETSPSPETEYLRSLVWTELEMALSELPPAQREVYEKTEIEGVSLKELSKQTGVGINTLLSRKHYAILHLRGRLRELYEEISSVQ